MTTCKRTLPLRLSFLATLALAWISLPFARTAPSAAPELTWYKGNLHTHTINSDGDSSPDVVARWYKEHRYNFLVLSDHNFLTSPQGLNAVLGAEGKFLLIPGEEVTSRYEDKSVHVNGYPLQDVVPPVFGHSVLDTIQKNVDAIRRAGGMPSLNHPNFRWSITPDDLKQVNNLRLFEVYNGIKSTNDLGGGGRPSLDEVWDIVLTAGREVYGIAVDDAHVFKQFAPELSNPGRGWVAVQASELSAGAVTQALDRGEFYASTGVELEDMQRTAEAIRLAIKPQGTAKYVTHFIGPEGRVLERSTELQAEYTLKPGDRYVRAKVMASTGDFAWVQPVFAR